MPASARLLVQVIDLEAAADDAPEPGPPPAASKPGNGASEAKKELAEAKWKGPAASGPAGTALGRPMDDYAQMGVLTANKTPAGICMYSSVHQQASVCPVLYTRRHLFV